jgi:NADPH2:quinone reductase
LKLLRPSLFGYSQSREEFEKHTGELFDFFIKDKMNVRIHEIYPMFEVQRPIEILNQGRRQVNCF